MAKATCGLGAPLDNPVEFVPASLKKKTYCHDGGDDGDDDVVLIMMMMMMRRRRIVMLMTTMTIMSTVIITMTTTLMTYVNKITGKTSHVAKILWMMVMPKGTLVVMVMVTIMIYAHCPGFHGLSVCE